MSLRVIKAGLLDTVQDLGRYGYQHLGINPGGAMDRFAAKVANILVGNDVHEAVIEMHFPAAAFLIEEDAVIAISGADFTSTVNGEIIPLLHPVIIRKNSVLQFERSKSGARCYLAVKEQFNIPEWLGSYSTNLKASAGGFNGRTLQRYDAVSFKKQADYTHYLLEKDFIILPWKADMNPDLLSSGRISVVAGSEWNWLNEESQQKFLSQTYNITIVSDRMGYRLNGDTLTTINQTEIVSSAVGFETIQLLPDGQLIVLMADHQTTGGYPRVAHIITAHLSKLAQMRPGEGAWFSMVDQGSAEILLMEQQQHLMQLQNACTFRLQEFFKN
jgi:antagonist of KipI